MSATHCRRPPSVSLQVEVLEERCVLSTAAYVNGLYNNLLHRTASPAEVVPWVTMLDSGVSPQQVATIFTTSTEFRRNLVRFDYKVLLNREPGANEITGGINFLQMGGREEQFEAAILASDEYFNLHAANAPSWLAAVFQDVLGQAPDLTFLTTANLNNVSNSFARGLTAFNVVNSTRVHTHVVTVDYEQLLLREPDAGGLSGFVSQLDHGTQPSQILVQIVSSTEYFALTSQGGLDGRPLGFVGPGAASPGTNPFLGTNLQGNPFVITPFTFNPILGTSLGGNNLFQALI